MLTVSHDSKPYSIDFNRNSSNVASITVISLLWGPFTPLLFLLISLMCWYSGFGYITLSYTTVAWVSLCFLWLQFAFKEITYSLIWLQQIAKLLHIVFIFLVWVPENNLIFSFLKAENVQVIWVLGMICKCVCLCIEGHECAILHMYVVESQLKIVTLAYAV